MAYGYGAPPRQESQVVQSGQQVRDDFSKAQQDYQNQLAQLQWQMENIATPQENAQQITTGHANSGAFDDFFKQQAAYNPVWNTQAQQDWYKQEYAKDVAPTILSGGNNASDAAYISQFKDTLGTAAGYDPKAVAAGYQSSIAGLNDAFGKTRADFEAFDANEKRQQQAYNQQSGGGFMGGIIDASYSDPFSNQISGKSVGGLGGLGGMQTDPSMPNVAMPWQQPWGTPGFGQPGQGNSQGVGGYSPTGQQSTNQQGSQWGGVFGAKNPWSPA